MTKYTEKDDEQRQPCPEPGCRFVATGKDAPAKLLRHLMEHEADRQERDQ